MDRVGRFGISHPFCSRLQRTHIYFNIYYQRNFSTCRPGSRERVTLNLFLLLLFWGVFHPPCMGVDSLCSAVRLVILLRVLLLLLIYNYISVGGLAFWLIFCFGGRVHPKSQSCVLLPIGRYLHLNYIIFATTTIVAYIAGVYVMFHCFCPVGIIYYFIN